MGSLETETVVAVISAFLIAGVVKGALGMGLPTISVAIMRMALRLREAIPVLMIPSFLANLSQFTRPGPIMLLFKRFGALNAMVCIGIWGGTMLLFRIDPAIINTLFGGVVIIYAAIAVPPILAGMTVGQWLRGRITDTKSRTAIFIILIVLAANLVGKGFM